MDKNKLISKKLSVPESSSIKVEEFKEIFDSFWNKELEENIRKEIIKRIDTQLESDGTSSIFEKKELIDARVIEEKVFCRKVLENLEVFIKANGQKDSLILWDIMGTLGKGKGDGYGFVLRETASLLLGFIKERYPQLEQGILTDNGRKWIEEYKEDLASILAYISPKHIYSLSRSDYKKTFSEIGVLEYDVDLKNYDSGGQKTIFSQKLEERGKHVFAIDDLPWAEINSLGIQIKSILLREFD